MPTPAGARERLEEARASLDAAEHELGMAWMVAGLPADLADEIGNQERALALAMLPRRKAIETLLREVNAACSRYCAERDVHTEIGTDPAIFANYTDTLPHMSDAEAFMGEGAAKRWLRNCQICRSTLHRSVPEQMP